MYMISIIELFYAYYKTDNDNEKSKAKVKGEGNDV